MARYLTRAQIHQLLQLLDEDDNTEPSTYQELRSFLLREIIPNYTGVKKYQNIRNYINTTVLPERRRAIKLAVYRINDLNGVMTPAATQFQHDIEQAINQDNDFVFPDGQGGDQNTNTDHLKGLIKALQNVRIRNKNKYLILTIFHGDQHQQTMKIINSETIDHLYDLLNTLQGHLPAIDDFDESDQAILFAFKRINGFTLEWFDYKPQKDGGFFPYYNRSDLDLSVFGIYHNKDEASYSDNCFTIAAINSGLFDKNEIDFIRTLINTRYLPRDELNTIASIMNVRIEVSYCSDRKLDKVVVYSPKSHEVGHGNSERVLKLILRCGHYLLYNNDLVPKNKYNVRNLNRLINKLFDDNQFIPMDDITDAAKFLSFKSDFQQLEYPPQSIRNCILTTPVKTYDFVMAAVFSSDVFTFFNKSIKLDELFYELPNNTLVYVPNLKGVWFTNEFYDVKPSIYRQTVQQIVLSQASKTITLRNAKSITAVDCSDMDIIHFDSFITQIRSIIRKELGVNMDQFYTLPNLVNHAAFQNRCFDRVFQLGGIVKQFASQCIHGGLVRNLYPHAFEINTPTTCFDINSSYATAMNEMDGIPIGAPIPFYKSIPDDACYAFIQINITNIQHDSLEPYSFIHPGINFVDSITLNEIKKYVDCDIEIINGYYFNKGFNTNIKSFVNKLYQLRSNPLLNKTVKNMLSSLYGKSLQNSQQFDIKVISKSKLQSFISKHGNYIYSIDVQSSTCSVKLMRALNLTFNMPQFGVPILSTSRSKLNGIIYDASVKHIPIYSIHTDSIMVPSDNDLNITVGTGLGEFKTEFNATSIKFISPKVYRAILTDGSVRSRGIVV